MALCESSKQRIRWKNGSVESLFFFANTFGAGGTYCKAEVESRTEQNTTQGQGHKKIRGQGQPFRGQILSMPRQEYSRLRPRTKDTVRRKCSTEEKKSLEKIFFRRSPKKRSKNIFRQSPKEENKKGLSKFPARFLALFNKISAMKKIVLSSNRREDNF